MKIEVTQEDILIGKAQDCYRCPVALAVTRAFAKDGAIKACVDGEEITVYYPGCLTKWDVEVPYECPPTAFDFIVAFDGGKDAKPFTFEITDPAMTAPPETIAKQIALNEAQIKRSKAVLDFCEAQEPMIYCHRCRKEPCQCGLMAENPNAGVRQAFPNGRRG